MIVVETRFLLANDVIAYTGETVIRTYADSKTPKGKRIVELNRNGVLVRKEWGAYTKIGVKRS
jgi:hypothetical protein